MTWDMINYLQEADMSFFLTPKTLPRSQVVDQIFPVLSDNLAIMIPYPKQESGISLTVSTSFTIVIIHCDSNLIWQTIYL